jgi:hypothetical protein
MGNGEVTGNMSVHWKIDHGYPNKPSIHQGNPNRPTGNNDVNTDSTIQGRDPKKATEILVRMRFASVEAAHAAWNQGVANPETTNGNVYVTVRVPMLTRAHPDDAPPADLRFEW